MINPLEVNENYLTLYTLDLVIFLRFNFCEEVKFANLRISRKLLSGALPTIEIDNSRILDLVKSHKFAKI